MRVMVEFCLLLLLASVCVAQGATAGVAEIRKVRITRTVDKTRLEFVLTRRVDPKLTVATETGPSSPRPISYQGQCATAAYCSQPEWRETGPRWSQQWRSVGYARCYRSRHAPPI